MPDKDIETRLSAARTRLIIDKPFLGALVLRLPMIAADPKWCKTTATDARSFYYNPDYVQALNLDQVQFMLAHEALHCALSHFARRGTRDKHRWDIACDYAINPLLLEDGLKPPPGILYERTYEGMTADEIYPYIDEMAEQDPLDQHLYDDQQDSDGRSDKSAGGEGKNEQQQSSSSSQSKGQGGSGGQPQEQQEGGQADGAPKPSPLTPSEQEQLRIQWQQRLAGAAQQARQAGKLGAGMARMIEFFLEPELPWRVLLARYLTSVARDDYSYLRPSNRRGDPFIFPSLRSAQIDMVVAVDVSGSVSEKEIGQFISEIDALKGQLRARITLHACDSNLVAEGPWYFEPWEEFSMPKQMQGGGGTSFKPIFDWVDTEDRPPDLLVYFTDAQGEFPDLPPQYPVVWLVKGKTKVPWGERVQLN